MSWSIEQKIRGGFGIALLFLAVMGLASWFSADRFRQTLGAVDHTHQVLRHLNRVLIGTLDLETAAREFVDSGANEFLQPCAAGQAAARESVRALRLLMVNNPDQHRRLETLDRLVARIIASATESIRLRRMGDEAGAVKELGVGRGRAILDEIRATVGDLEAAERRVLAQRTAAAQALNRASNAIVVTGMLIAVIMAGLASVIVQRDFQVRRQAETALQASAARVQDLYNHAPCGYHSLDAEGRFAAINDTELAWLGYGREELLGRKRFAEVLTPESRQRFGEKFPLLKQQGWVRDLEFQMVRRDGTFLSVLLNATAVRDAAGRFQMSRATVFDITERKQAEDERDRFFVLSRDLLCIAGFDGYFKRLNPAWERTLGYAQNELLAQPFIEFVHPDDREATLAEAQKLSAGGETVYFANRYRCRDGSFRWLLWTAAPLVGQGLIFAAARDITERHLKDQEIQRLTAELQARAALLETANQELEAFSYSVSHDLRAPLRHINGFVDLLVKRLAPTLDDQSRRYLQTIAGSAQQMGRLIDDLLVFSRMGRAGMQQTPVDLERLVQETIRGRQPETGGRNVTWKNSRLPAVHADPAMLRLVLENLIDNALKYTRPRDPAVIEITGYTTDHEHVISVRDNGVGFDMRYVDKLFGVFQRLHRAEEFEGTGIGLANVRRIIHRHGGRTWAEGRVDAGAAFFFSLPKSIERNNHGLPQAHPVG